MWKTLSGVKLDDIALSKHATSGVNLSQSWSSTSKFGEAAIDDSDDENIRRAVFNTPNKRCEYRQATKDDI